ncbi:MAG TPA: TPM domain-containing protein, partial [Planctomycetaceae bacterium]|nr:TPM domain-containing protein [Planctomycetaceae bacterium]
MVARLVLLAVALAQVDGRPATPFPAFTGERVYVAGVPDVYDPVRRAVTDAERSSRQTYYVVVVATTGEGESATRDYADRLYQAWLQQANGNRLEFDTDRSLLIVLAVDNRQLSVRPGTALERDLGLTGGIIDRDLVAPHFVPHARRGDFAEGLVTLVREAGSWIARRDPQVERPAESSAVPAAVRPANAAAGNAAAGTGHAASTVEPPAAAVAAAGLADDGSWSAGGVL